MAVLTILTAPNKKLEIPAEKVTDVSTVQTLIDDMLDTMYETDDGIGLASTQVGRKEAVVVIDISEGRNEPMVLINPVVVEGESIESGQEGCLSIPGYYADVDRYTKVKVTALDRDGNAIEINDDGFLAIAMQHEIDHLKGTLFIDYLSPLKKKMALKKVKKTIKEMA
ncbi:MULTISPECIES: peptide deformylase [unclassified Moritella]|uniref:peptide deformylase n=1 Tax=unclassified Moritella TaxID=2637987 RepID=UPI001BACADE6|nr:MULTISPECIES: peptide deformylase [unclassified Moritella]QUM85412.1 peptide deformylase [Moritella sp. 28]QUM89647.1 peptide deformylase [Moritella sp. 36]